MANIFELPSKGGNISPEKAHESRQMHFRDYVGGEVDGGGDDDAGGEDDGGGAAQRSKTFYW